MPRRLQRLVLLGACAACAPSGSSAPGAALAPTPTVHAQAPAPASLPPVEPSGSSVQPSASPSGTAVDHPFSWQAPMPSERTAGAERCTISAPVVLSRQAYGHAILGFRSREGLAALLRDASTLVLVPLTSAGAVRGPATSVSVPEGFEPKRVFALEQSFLVLLLHWDHAHGTTAWLGLAVDSEARAPHPPDDLGLADLNLVAGQAVSAQSVGLVMSAAYIASHKPASRWQTVTVRTDGAIESALVSVLPPDLLHGSTSWEPAERGSSRGWLVQTPRGWEGLFDGVRGPATDAVRLWSSDAIRAEIGNDAVPGGRMPGGVIRERFSRPVLVRHAADGADVGARLMLEWQGTSVGGGGIYVDPYLEWSGTHFLYPFSGLDAVTRNSDARLLPIDCRR